MYSGNQPRMCRHFFKHFFRHYLTLNWTIFRKGRRVPEVTILESILYDRILEGKTERAKARTTTSHNKQHRQLLIGMAAPPPTRETWTDLLATAKLRWLTVSPPFSPSHPSPPDGRDVGQKKVGSLSLSKLSLFPPV